MKSVEKEAQEFLCVVLIGTAKLRRVRADLFLEVKTFSQR